MYKSVLQEDMLAFLHETGHLLAACLAVTRDINQSYLVIVLSYIVISLRYVDVPDGPIFDPKVVDDNLDYTL